MVYAFIDAQNLYLGIKSQGWKLDYKKFYVYLKEKYKADEVFMYIGYVKGNETLYQRLRGFGYQLVFRQTRKYSFGNNKIKGNVDVSLTVDAIRKSEKYKRAIFVSADGDFCPLYDYLIDEKKKEILIMVPNSYSYSRFLLKYHNRLRYMNNLKEKLSV